MRNIRGTLLTLLAQQSGQINLLIVAPILTLSFLSLIVRTASSAVDSSVEKRKVTEQLKRRLSEVQNEKPGQGEDSKLVARPKPTLVVATPAAIQETQTPATLEVTKFQVAAPRPLLLITPIPLARKQLLPLAATVKVGKRASLGTLLSDQGLDKAESSPWLMAAKKQRVLQKLTSGKAVEFSFIRAKKDDERELHSLVYRLDERSSLFLEKKADGKIAVRKETLPLVLVWKGIGGQVAGSLAKSAQKAGLPKRLTDDLAELDWDIDIASGLHRGATFKIIFEEFQVAEKPIKTGRLLAAEIVNKGRTYTAFSFPEPRSIMVSSSKGKPNGTFLRYPLEFTSITSVFTDARMHPILERIRPHTGVDFSAPRGTPVHSIANGEVIFAGRQSGYGFMVRIDHQGPYDSAYAHLDRIAEGVLEGVSIDKGQVIGFVGSTGLATGPHLHFEIYRNGEFVDPLTAKLDIKDDLQKKANPAFAAKKNRALDQLTAMQVGDQPLVLSRVFSRDGKPVAQKSTDDENRFAFATTPGSFSLIPGLSTTQAPSSRKKSAVSKRSPRNRNASQKNTSSLSASATKRTGKAIKGEEKRQQNSTRSEKARNTRTARR
ncbi:MAG: M23 family metallopeptidase [Deltaproteobacteria bacterium]|nr:M23 family metallopeptidase [Deltaproteobacteria bacterium]